MKTLEQFENDFNIDLELAVLYGKEGNKEDLVRTLHYVYKMGFFDGKDEGITVSFAAIKEVA